jgi:hypothetical protein
MSTVTVIETKPDQLQHKRQIAISWSYVVSIVENHSSTGEKWIRINLVDGTSMETVVEFEAAIGLWRDALKH